MDAHGRADRGHGIEQAHEVHPQWAFTLRQLQTRTAFNATFGDKVADESARQRRPPAETKGRDVDFDNLVRWVVGAGEMRREFFIKLLQRPVEALLPFVAKSLAPNRAVKG